VLPVKYASEFAKGVCDIDAIPPYRAPVYIKLLVVVFFDKTMLSVDKVFEVLLNARFGEAPKEPS
jgi:hypothetical protein